MEGKSNTDECLVMMDPLPYETMQCITAKNKDGLPIKSTCSKIEPCIMCLPSIQTPTKVKG